MIERLSDLWRQSDDEEHTENPSVDNSDSDDQDSQTDQQWEPSPAPSDSNTAISQHRGRSSADKWMQEFNKKASDRTTPHFMQDWIDFTRAVGSNLDSLQFFSQPKDIYKRLKAPVTHTTLNPTNHADYRSVAKDLKAKKKVNRAKLWSVVLRLRGQTEDKFGTLRDRSVVDAMGRIAKALAKHQELTLGDVTIYTHAEVFENELTYQELMNGIDHTIFGAPKDLKDPKLTVTLVKQTSLLSGSQQNLTSTQTHQRITPTSEDCTALDSNAEGWGHTGSENPFADVRDNGLKSVKQQHWKFSSKRNPTTTKRYKEVLRGHKRRSSSTESGPAKRAKVDSQNQTQRHRDFSHALASTSQFRIPQPAVASLSAVPAPRPQTIRPPQTGDTLAPVHQPQNSRFGESSLCGFGRTPMVGNTNTNAPAVTYPQGKPSRTVTASSNSPDDPNTQPVIPAIALRPSVWIGRFNDKMPDGITPKWQQKWINFANKIFEVDQQMFPTQMRDQIIADLAGKVTASTLNPTNHISYRNLNTLLHEDQKVDKTKMWAFVLRLQGHTTNIFKDVAGKSVIDAMGRVAVSLSKGRYASPFDIARIEGAAMFGDDRDKEAEDAQDDNNAAASLGDKAYVEDHAYHNADNYAQHAAENHFPANVDHQAEPDVEIIAVQPKMSNGGKGLMAKPDNDWDVRIPGLIGPEATLERRATASRPRMKRVKTTHDAPVDNRTSGNFYARLSDAAETDATEIRMFESRHESARHTLDRIEEAFPAIEQRGRFLEFMLVQMMEQQGSDHLDIDGYIAKWRRYAAVSGAFFNMDAT